MTLEKEYFIHLLYSFVNGVNPEACNVDMDSIIKLSDLHDVQGIISQQLSLLPQSDLQNKSLLIQYIGRTVQSSALKDIALEKAEGFLKANNIDYVIVKGAVLKKYYPVPELRTSGDIDIILRQEQFEGIISLLKKDGFDIVNVAADTITVTISDVKFEFHNSADVVSDYFDSIFELCKNEGNHYFFDEYNHLAYVICHLFKHLRYRGAGIRMLLDIDLMIRGINDFDCERLFDICRKANILNSTKALLKLCQTWFDTPVGHELDTDISELLSSFETVFLDGGVFGTAVNAIPIRNMGEGRLKTLMKLAFPRKALLRNAYPYYNKNHMLLPIARVNRLYDALTKKRNVAISTAKQLGGKNDGAKTLIALINELDL